MAKKLEDDDPDYVPNIFDAADSEDEGDVSNQKRPPETIAVLGKETVYHPSVTVTDGMQIYNGMQTSDTVSDEMQNIAPMVHTPLISSTDLLLQDIILLKMEELVSVFLLCLIYSLTIYLSNLSCSKWTHITILRTTKATNIRLVN